MATKIITTGYQEVNHILPADILDLQKLTEAGGRVIEEFTVEVQRAKLETDYLVKIAIPADKIEQFGGISVGYVDGKWLSSPVKKEDHAITEEVEDPDPIETFGLDEADPLFETKRQILQAERAEQAAKEAEQRAAAEDALTAKALAVEKLTAKGKSVQVALAELAAAKEPGL